MIEIYTSFGSKSGKGKTTAAIGLAIRAAGHGKRVCWIAFDKGGNDYGEDQIFEKIGIECVRTGRDRRRDDGGFDFSITDEDRAEAMRGIALAKERIDKIDLLVLDEAIGAVSLGLLPESALIEVLKTAQGRADLEIVATGRNATDGLVEIADLVTEMRKNKHYFDAGAAARAGVEF